MPLRKLKVRLWMAIVILLAGSPAVVLWGLWGKLSIQPPLAVQVTSEPLKDNRRALRNKLPIKDLQSVARLRLRKPFDEVKTKRPVLVAKSQAPKLPIKLLGTVIESEHSMALFATLHGQPELHRVGEIVGPDPAGPKVVSINTAHVEMNHNGSTFRLEIEAPKEK